MVGDGLELLRVGEELHEEIALELLELVRVDLHAKVRVDLEDSEIEELLKLGRLLVQVLQRRAHVHRHLDVHLGQIVAEPRGDGVLLVLLVQVVHGRLDDRLEALESAAHAGHAVRETVRVDRVEHVKEVLEVVVQVDRDGGEAYRVEQLCLVLPIRSRPNIQLDRSLAAFFRSPLWLTEENKRHDELSAFDPSFSARERNVRSEREWRRKISTSSLAKRSCGVMIRDTSDSLMPCFTASSPNVA